MQNGKSEIGQFEFSIFDEDIFRFKILMKNFSFPQNLIASHELVEYIEDLLFIEIEFPLFTKILKSSLRTILHKNIIEFGRIAFKGLHDHQILVRRKFPNDIDFLFDFLSFFFIVIRNYFSDQHFLRSIIPNSFLDYSEAALPNHLVVENQKLVFLSIEFPCNN